MTCVRHALPALAAVMLTCGPALAIAQPAPVQPALFPFPSATLGPADAASAALGFADRWLGDEPFDNPAAAPRRGARVTPQLAFLSRQDIHANNRDIDQGGPSIDFAGARVSAPLGAVSFSLYAWQPVFRVDNVGFTVGRTVPVAGSPAAVSIDGSVRELRAGLAVSVPALGGRIGVGGEYVDRSDRYERREVSGSPDAGTEVAEFSGSAFGATAGARWEHDPDAMWGWSAGAAARWNAELEVTGSAVADRLSGDSEAAVAATRAAGFEGGAGLRMTVGRGARVLASAGGGAARAWDGFANVDPGATFEWRLGADLRDPEAPWVVRFGVGQENQPGTPEPRAGHVSAGFGWTEDDFTIDVGVVRRTIDRPGQPRSHDDRAVVSVGLDF